MRATAASQTHTLVSDAEAARASRHAAVSDLETDMDTVALSLGALVDLIYAGGDEVEATMIVELIRPIAQLAKGLTPRMLSITTAD